MVETRTRFFGYGSLVNLATHNYKNVHKIDVQGWRRQWVYSATRDISFFSVTKDPDTTLQGVVADVSDIGWQALDIREAGYLRHDLSGGCNFSDVQVYVANPDHVDPKGFGKPILLSYLDCVVQGFLDQFGEDGVTGFFNTTSGWDRPIKNDRAAPIFPRAQVLSTAQTALVDRHLQDISANIVP